MDTNNWRPNAPTGEPPMDTTDWRTQLQPDSRQRIVNKIMDTLRRHLPFSGDEGLNELRKIAVGFEEKIYTAAISQSDYLRRISLKMLTMENKSQSTIPNPGGPGNSSKPPDPGVGPQNMQSQVHSQGQTLTLPGNQSQARQPLMSQNVQNNIASAGIQSSAGLPSALPNARDTIFQDTNLPTLQITGADDGDDIDEEGITLATGEFVDVTEELGTDPTPAPTPANLLNNDTEEEFHESDSEGE